MGEDVLAEGHDFRNARLVVTAQQRGAVGHDQVFINLIGQGRIICGFHHDAFFFVQRDVAALIPQDARVHRPAGHGVGGIHMGDQANRRGALRIGGNEAVHIAVSVHPHVGQPQFLHFLFQLPGQYPLVFGGRAIRAGFVAGGVDIDVAQKTFLNPHDTNASFHPLILFVSV